MDKLFWPQTHLLESVGANEPQVEAMRKTIVQCITLSLVPLRYLLSVTNTMLYHAVCCVIELMLYDMNHIWILYIWT